jgi:hypothetical protein
VAAEDAGSQWLSNASLAYFTVRTSKRQKRGSEYQLDSRLCCYNTVTGMASFRLSEIGMLLDSRATLRFIPSLCQHIRILVHIPCVFVCDKVGKDAIICKFFFCSPHRIRHGCRAKCFCCGLELRTGVLVTCECYLLQQTPIFSKL